MTTEALANSNHSSNILQIDSNTNENEDQKFKIVAFSILYGIGCIGAILLSVNHLRCRVKNPQDQDEKRNKFLNKIKNTQFNRNISKLISQYSESWGLVDPTIISLLQQNKKIQNILDIGCGTGDNILEITAKTKVQKITGIDISDDALSSFAARLLIRNIFYEYNAKMGVSMESYKKEQRVNLFNEDITQIPTFGKNDEYEIVVCTDTLQYLTPIDMLKIFEKINRCVSLNGYFIGSLLISKTSCSGQKVTVYDGNALMFIRSLLNLFGFRLEGNLKIESEWLDNGRTEKYTFVAKKIGGVFLVAEKFIKKSRRDESSAFL